MAHKILIVEDNPVQMKLATKMLEVVDGYEIFQAADGAQTRECLSNEKMDLVLCDIGLPDESGLDLAAFIIQTYPQTIVVMLTASDDMETSQKALDIGALKFLVKPVKPAQLRISVANALKVWEFQQIITKQKETLENKIVHLVKAKVALGESEADLKAILENIQEGFFRVDSNGKIVFANSAFVSIAGYESFEEIKNMDISSFYSNSDDYTRFLKEIQQNSSVSTYEINMEKKGGTPAVILVNAYMRKDANGKEIGIEGTILDITQRKTLELDLLQAQKLESVGQLAAGIAHEINTPIQYVGDNISFLKDAFEDIFSIMEPLSRFLEDVKKGKVDTSAVEEIEELIEDADMQYLSQEVPVAIDQSLDGVQRVSKIVKSMKEFSHPGSDEMEMTDLNHAIENTVTVARNEWKYVADLKMNFDESLPQVPCNPGELNQVFLNMIINASHAISDVLGDHPQGRGEITITTLKKDDNVQIKIQDTGSGIPKKIRDKIFDPFFTTKEVGKGTGQGLAISHSVIVDKHKGKIDIKSEKNKGTCFTISLPLG